MDAIGPGTLKLVSGWSTSRLLDPMLEQTLIDRLGSNNVRRLHEGLFIVYTDAEPENIRDWLTKQLRESDSVFVVEFERWSSRGYGVDKRWLLRRGH